MSIRYPNRLVVAALSLAAGLTLGACERETPLERVGEEVDEAAEDISAGGERLDNKLDDAVDELKE